MDYYKKLGFGQKTNIDLPNEYTGKVKFKYDVEVVNAGFGQGITTTPIQNVKAMTPLTNDGMLLEPYLISKIVDSETGEVVLENKRTEIERVASTDTVNKMMKLMDDTVNGIGNTGSGYRIDSGELIGKTGTAQIANEKSGGYLNGKDDIISSFSGVYPKINPRVIIYASVKRPSGGSQKPISNAVKEIVNNLSKYYGNDDSSNKVEINDYKVKNYINKKIDKVKLELESNKINYVVLGQGDKIVKQTPSSGDVITTNDTVYLITNDSNITVPSVVGLSSKVAKSILNNLGIKVKLDGVGYVSTQSVAESTQISDGMEIILTLNPRFSTEGENG